MSGIYCQLGNYIYASYHLLPEPEFSPWSIFSPERCAKRKKPSEKNIIVSLKSPKRLWKWILKKSEMFPFESSSSRKSPGSQHDLAGSLFLILTTRHPGLYRLLKFGNYLDPKKTYHPNTEAQEVFAWMFIGYVHRFGK